MAGSPRGDVDFDQALDILEIAADELEQLLLDGTLKAYRRGDDVFFRRDDIAEYVIHHSASPSGAKATPAGRQAPASAQKARPSPARPQAAVPTIPLVGLDNGPAESSLRSENEALKMRLKAAEEVLQDLQSRCEKLSGIEARNQALAEQARVLQEARTELEAKLAAYQEMESGGVAGTPWGRRDPESEGLELRRQAAELRGDLAALQHRLEERENDLKACRVEHEELVAVKGQLEARDKELGKLRAECDGLAAARQAGATERETALEAQLQALREERDTLAIEAELARELKGEIDRAAELEEKLSSQREIIEAAQAGLSELEGERDALSARIVDLDGRAAEADTVKARVIELAARVGELEPRLEEAEQQATQLGTRVKALKKERDELSSAVEKRDEELAQLRPQAETAKTASAEVERLKAEAKEAEAKISSLEETVGGFKAQLSLKEQLVGQLKEEGQDQAELMTENAKLRERLAEAEGKSKQATARVAAMRAERDGLAAELSKREGAMEELRPLAERANSLLASSHALKQDLDAARDRLAEVEPLVERLTRDREKLQAELASRAEQVEKLDRDLADRRREVATTDERSVTTPPQAAGTNIMEELNTLRSEITRQMQEIGEMRARGEAASHRRSARAVAPRKAPILKKKAASGAGGKLTKLGRYEIGRQVRRTRSGTYRMAAVQPTGREVEILVLPSEFTRDRVFLDRFWRDIRVIAELDAKELLAIEDVGESDGTHYVVYEHIEAETLDAALHRGEMPPPRAVEIAAVLLDALDVAARRELVHGDVKPENVLLCADGGTKLAGLGLARGTGEDASALGERGRIVHYGAPEQILHETRSQRGDIYSVGALLYHMASGRPPMEGQSLGEVQGLVEAHELPRVEDLMNVPENVCEVLKKMLAEDPAERYDAPAAAAKALRDIGL